MQFPLEELFGEQRQTERQRLISMP